MPSTKPFVKAYLTPEEHAQVEKQAKKASLSVSKYVAAACLKLNVTSTVDQQAVLSLTSCKADLGRLGGLLKQCLAEVSPKTGDQWQKDLRNLLKQIENTQRDLRRDYRTVANALNKGAK